MTLLQCQIAIIDITAAVHYLHKNDILLVKLNPYIYISDKKFYSKIACVYILYLKLDQNIIKFLICLMKYNITYHLIICLIIHKVDIYSFAFVIYSLNADVMSFNEKRSIFRFEKIFNEHLPPQFTKEFSEPIHELVFIPFERPKIKEIFDMVTNSTKYYIND